MDTTLQRSASLPEGHHDLHINSSLNNIGGVANNKKPQKIFRKSDPVLLPTVREETATEVTSINIEVRRADHQDGQPQQHPDVDENKEDLFDDTVTWL